MFFAPSPLPSPRSVWYSASTGLTLPKRARPMDSKSKPGNSVHHPQNARNAVFSRLFLRFPATRCTVHNRLKMAVVGCQRHPFLSRGGIAGRASRHRGAGGRGPGGHGADRRGAGLSTLPRWRSARAFDLRPPSGRSTVRRVGHVEGPGSPLPAVQDRSPLPVEGAAVSPVLPAVPAP